MLRHTILFTIAFIYSLSVKAQATLYTEDFEVLNPTWIATDDLTPNFWLQKDCAGNGPTFPGTESMYITKGGPDAGCGATGDSQYAYENAPSGTNMATIYTTVDATCATSIQVTFDYRLEGVLSEDTGELVFSTDGGTTWTNAGGLLTQSATWTTTTVSLPAAVDGISFELGFRFSYNDVTITGAPLAIDNIVVTGTDTIDPAMICPASIDLPVNGTCTAICDDYTKSMVSLSDNCTDSVDIVVTQDIPEFTVFPSAPGGFESITLTAADESGNTTQCTITLNVIDNILPIATCPADTNVYVDNNCDGILEDYTGDVLVSDNCSATANISVSQSPAPGLVISGTIVITPVTMTITDESGNSTTCIFEARTIDTMVATITCPIDTNVYANAACDGLLEDYTGEAIIYDNCTPISSLTVTQSPAPGSTISADQVITLTVSGAIPNIDQSCTFNALLVDTTAPSIVCPVPTDLYVDNSCEALLADYSGMAVVTENCTGAPSISQSPAPGTIVNVTSNVTVTLTATDGSGNSAQCQFTQPIFDTISPIATCPIDQSENADINCQALLSDYTALVTTSDNCSAILTLAQSPAAGTTISGTTVITMTLEDEYSNTSTCVFNVDIIDAMAPTATCPSNMTVGTNSGCDYILADLTGSVTGADNCTPAVSLTYSQSPSPGTLLPLGASTITMTVSDLEGNNGSCMFDVTVEDQTSPIITTCPSNQNVYADASCQSTINDYTGLVVANDNCSSVGNLTISQSPAVSTVISTTTPITITVTDENLNTTSCVFNAIFIDTITPILTCPTDQIVSIDASCQFIMPDLSGSISGADNCSSLGNMTIGQNPVAGSTQTGQTAVLITLTDEGGNSATCILNMIPDDTSGPTITCPNPAPVDLGINCDYLLPNYGTMASVLDNCNGYSITQTPAAGIVVNTGASSITLEVTDAGGNTDQCSFILQVTESQAPTITCPSNITTCDSIVTYTDPTFSDNCFAFLTQTDMTGLSSGMVFPIGTTTLEYTVLDSSANSSTCTFDIQVLEYPSAANILDDTIYLCNQNSTVLSADPVTSGQPLWSIIQGSGSLNNQFANVTGVNNLPFDTTIFIWEVSTTSCGFTSDTVIVINSQQDLLASTQDTIYSCADPTVLLQSNAPLYGIGTWTSPGANGGTIDDINSANTFANTTYGWQEYIWTITNGSCPASSDTLHVFSVTTPTIDQPDTLVCLENDLLTLSSTISPPNDQNITWQVAFGQAIIDDPSNATTTVHDFGLGTNMIICTYTHDICPSTSDTIIISGNLCDGFDPVIPTVITPGNLDGKNDVFEIDFLNTVYPECHVLIFNRWGSVVFESTGYEDPWNGTHEGKPLPMGTYFYRIELNDGSGEVLKGDISIIH